MKRREKIAELQERQTRQLAKLVDIEQQIYDLEGSYLEETQSSGSALKVHAASPAPCGSVSTCPSPSLPLALLPSRLSWALLSTTLSASVM